MAEPEEEEEGQVEASLEELIAKKADRPTITDDDDEDESMLALGRDEARESLTTKVLPVQQNEFVCKNCFLVKHRSQLADRRRQQHPGERGGQHPEGGPPAHRGTSSGAMPRRSPGTGFAGGRRAGCGA